MDRRLKKMGAGALLLATALHASAPQARADVNYVCDVGAPTGELGENNVVCEANGNRYGKVYVRNDEDGGSYVIFTIEDPHANDSGQIQCEAEIGPVPVHGSSGGYFKRFYDFHIPFVTLKCGPVF